MPTVATGAAAQQLLLVRLDKSVKANRTPFIRLYLPWLNSTAFLLRETLLNPFALGMLGHPIATLDQFFQLTIQERALPNNWVARGYP